MIEDVIQWINENPAPAIVIAIVVVGLLIAGSRD